MLLSSLRGASWSSGLTRHYDEAMPRVEGSKPANSSSPSLSSFFELVAYSYEASAGASVSEKSRGGLCRRGRRFSKAGAARQEKAGAANWLDSFRKWNEDEQT